MSALGIDVTSVTCGDICDEKYNIVVNNIVEAQELGFECRFLVVKIEGVVRHLWEVLLPLIPSEKRKSA